MGEEQDKKIDLGTEHVEESPNKRKREPELTPSKKNRKYVFGIPPKMESRERFLDDASVDKDLDDAIKKHIFSYENFTDCIVGQYHKYRKTASNPLNLKDFTRKGLKKLINGIGDEIKPNMSKIFCYDYEEKAIKITENVLKEMKSELLNKTKQVYIDSTLEFMDKKLVKEFGYYDNVDEIPLKNILKSITPGEFVDEILGNEEVLSKYFIENVDENEYK